MRKRGDRVRITSGKHAGHQGSIESNVYQKTVDYPDEFHNGHHVMVDTEELVTVRWDQVVVCPHQYGGSIMTETATNEGRYEN